MARKTTRNRPIRRTLANSQRHSGHSHLTYVRYLTASRLAGSFSKSKNYKTARDSSQSGARFWHTKPDLHSFEYSGDLSLKIKNSYSSPTSFDTQRICKSRKERREVLFAKGKAGGNHKPPTYTLDSLVRC